VALLSEIRQRRREKSKKKERDQFLARPSAPVVSDRGTFLLLRSQWIFATRRLGILYQRPDLNTAEICRLENARAAIQKEIPDIAKGLTKEILCPTFLEI